MNKAKAAVSEFMSKAGHHDTTVHETIQPAVKHETVKPVVHEAVETAVQKEIHQDHYHHTVQPIHDKEVLPEKHHHNLGEVEKREFDHRDHDHTKQAIAAETSKFRDERTVHDTTHTKTHAPTIQGEHVHHHLHETIQPVIHKEVVQPNVVHTTVPIHEVHHNTAQHHSTSQLPPIHMSDYKKQGGVLGEREERFDSFAGEPNISAIHSNRNAPGHSHNVTEGTHHGDFDGKDHRVGTDSHHTSGTTGTTGSSSTGKPGLLNKLNPMTDANGDGNKGFMK